MRTRALTCSVPDALLFREVGDPGVFRPLADNTAVVGQVRCGTEPAAAEDPRLIRHERGYCHMRLFFDKPRMSRQRPRARSSRSSNMRLLSLIFLYSVAP